MIEGESGGAVSAGLLDAGEADGAAEVWIGFESGGLEEEGAGFLGRAAVAHKVNGFYFEGLGSPGVFDFGPFGEFHGAGWGIGFEGALGVG